jgi:hypothetical protein
METLPYDRQAHLSMYHSEVFTQLVLNGLTIQAAKERANEAVDYISKLNLPIPEIKVG